MENENLKNWARTAPAHTEDIVENKNTREYGRSLKLIKFVELGALLRENVPQHL